MSTIKYLEDEAGTKKVIISVTDGQTQVSCECCGGCAAYPAFPVLAGSDNQGNDVFEQWTAYSANLPGWINFYGGALAKNGTSYGNTTNGVFLEGQKWAVYRNGTRTEKDYLISGGIKDLFLDQYAVSWSSGSNNYAVTLIRSGGCTWNSSFVANGCAIGGAILSIADDGWNFAAVSLSQNGGPCYTFGTSKYPDHQNGPAGSWRRIVVS